jgi:ParB family chromosome partitioning protein
MAKLAESISNTGMNSGDAVVARMMRTADIKTEPALEGIFAIKTETLEAVIASMKENGYDKAEPIVVWKGKNLVVDGHTRLKAAIAAEISEVPAEEKEFASLDEAKQYTKKRQINRRNLNQSEILEAAGGLQNKAERNGSGRAAEILAKELGVSASVVQRARAVAASAPPEVINQVKHNELSINQAYNLVKKETPKPEAGDIKRTQAQIHKSSIEFISGSPATQDAFKNLLCLLHTLETSGTNAAPICQDTLELLKPFFDNDFLSCLTGAIFNVPKNTGTPGETVES